MLCTTKPLYTRRFVMPNINIRLNYREMRVTSDMTSQRQSNFKHFSVIPTTMKKKDKKELVDKVALGMAIILKESDERAARKIRKHIVEAAKEVVKRFARHLPDADPAGDEKPKAAAGGKAVKAAAKQPFGKNGVVAAKKKTAQKSR